MSNRAAQRRAAKQSARRRPSPVVSNATIASVDSASVAREPEALAREPEALVVTHYFDWSDPEGLGRSATIRLSGRRLGVEGTRTPKDGFTQEDRVEGILPGSGPASVTSWVYGLTPGEWEVAAEVLGQGDSTDRHRRTKGSPIRPARWSWRRWALSVDAPRPVRTRWAPLAPLARIPGVIPGIWPILGAVAVVVAVSMQRVMLPHENVAVEVPLVVTVIALVSGLVAAKIWYAVLHPGPWRQAMLGGWAVDGFLLVAPVVAVAILFAFGLPVGAFLDAVTPGLFLAVAIGRIGCFLAGCCAGRLTRARWGIWSSDRKVGARRIPVQLLESAAGLMIGLVSTLLILGHVPRIDGSIFLGAFAVYFVVRQTLLRVRAERREFLWRRTAGAVVPA